MALTAVIVDDDHDDLELLTRVIATYYPDIHCICFNGAEEALRAVTQELLILPDFIITDINMPGMTGDVLIVELKKHSELAHVIIGVLSTHMPGEKAEAMKKLGATHAFQKPVEYPGYKQILEKLFAKK